MGLIKRCLHITRGKKGFTLLEVVVASAISSVVLMCAIGMFVPLMNSTRTNKELADAKNSAARIIDYIHRKVQYSGGIIVTSSDVYSSTSTPTIYQARMPVDPLDPLKSESLRTYYTSTGDIADAVDILGDDAFYGGMDFVITYQQAMDRTVTPPVNKQAVEVTITATRKQQERVIYKVTETLYMFNGGVVDTSAVNLAPVVEEFQYITF